jgi:isoleucyl-tRNA synthetase
VIPGGRQLDIELVDILEDELNVKRVVFLAESSDLIRLRAKPDFGALGPRFGSRTPQIARAVESLDVDALRELRDGREIQLEVDGDETVIRPEDVEIIEDAEEGLVVGGSQGYLAALDRELDDQLRGEGLARELVSRVQRLRRDSGLDVSDRIELQISGAEEIEAAATSHREYIAGETLALDLQVGGAPDERFDNVREVEIEGSPVRIGLFRVERGPPAG